MIDKLQAIEDKYLELEQLISDPEIIANQNEWQKLTRNHAKLTAIITVFREYKQVKQGIADAYEMLEDKLDTDFRDMVQSELAELKEKALSQEEELRVLLLPRDPNDDKNVIIEIRGGVGDPDAVVP